MVFYLYVEVFCVVELVLWDKCLDGFEMDKLLDVICFFCICEVLLLFGCQVYREVDLLFMGWLLDFLIGCCCCIFMSGYVWFFFKLRFIIIRN